MKGHIINGKSDKYELLDRIGSGGFGDVYKAQIVSSSKIVAIKIFKNELDPDDKEAVLDWQREAEQALAFDHSNIITSIEFGQSTLDTGLAIYYLVMEYAENGSLKILIDSLNTKGESISEVEGLSIFKQVLNGLNEIHKTAIHRDLKPENLLFVSNSIKISDFGLAKYVDQSTRTRTYKGGGTYLYMSPECWTFGKITNTTDIYSLGIVMYQLFTGELPYDSSDYKKLEEMHRFSDIPRARAKNPTLSHKIDGVIFKMMNKASSDRYQNVEEILAELSRSAPSPAHPSIDSILTIAKKVHDREEHAKSEAQRRYEQEQNRMKSNLLKINELVSTIREVVDEINESLPEQKLSVSKGSNTDYTIIWGTKDMLRFSFNTHMYDSDIKIKGHSIPAYGYSEFRVKSPKDEGMNYALCVSDDNEYGQWKVLEVSYNVFTNNAPYPRAVDFSVLKQLSDLGNAMGVFQCDIRDGVKEEIRTQIEKAFKYLENPPEDSSGRISGYGTF